MNILERDQLVRATDGRVLRGHEGSGFSAVFTDTRSPVQGGLFFALDGPNFDAHAFLSKAIEGGAGGLVISKAEAVPDQVPSGLFILLVDNTRLALGAIARASRIQQAAKVIAITGSVGKTTMKNMVAAALTPFGKVGRTPGNYNNDIGLPLTLCGLDGDEDFVVLELGMNAPGEIHALTQLALPDVGLVTGAHAAHLEFFPSVDAIADAKAELYATLAPEAIAIANGDDTRIVSRAGKLHPRSLMTYGYAEDATVRVVSATPTQAGVMAHIEAPTYGGTIQIPALGEHHALHAAGALAVVSALGLDLAIAAGAIEATYEGEKHRMKLLHTESGVTILDDCYNASPVSMKAALETFGALAQGAQRRIAVLGSMLELGKDAPQFHQEAGKLAARVGIDHLYALGPFAEDLARGATGEGLDSSTQAEDVGEVLTDIVDSTLDQSWLLLKGSRGGRLERVLSSYSIVEAR